MLVTVAHLAEFDEIIDVRTPAEYAKGHLAGTENIPIESIAAAAFNPSDTIVLLSDGAPMHKDADAKLLIPKILEKVRAGERLIDEDAVELLVVQDL